MNVRQVIDLLSQYDKNLEVYVNRGDTFEITQIQTLYDIPNPVIGIKNSEAADILFDDAYLRSPTYLLDQERIKNSKIRRMVNALSELGVDTTLLKK